MNRRYKAILVATVLAVLLTGVGHWPAASGRATFFHMDVALQNYPYRRFFWRHLRQGELPLWCRSMYCGYPLFAEGQGTPLYPVQVLLGLVPSPTHAFNLLTLLHLAGAGVSMALLLRALGLRGSPVVFGALVYMLSLPVQCRVRHTNVLVSLALLPGYLALLRTLANRATWPRLLAMGILVSFLCLGGHPYFTLYSLALGALYFLCGCPTFAPGRSPGWRAAAYAALPHGLGIALAGGQLAPTWELVRQCVDHGPADYGFMSLGSLPPSGLVGILTPRYFGSPAFDTYWGYVSQAFYQESALYVGAIACVCAAVGVAYRRRAAAFFFCVICVSLVLALGNNAPFHKALACLPVMSATRLPVRLVTFAGMSICVLAGEGLHQLLHARSRRPARMAASAALVLAAAGWVLVFAAHGPFMFRPRAAALGLGLPARDAAQLARLYARELWPGLVLSIVLTAAAASAAWLPVTGLMRRRVAVALLVLAVLEVLSLTLLENPTQPSSILQQAPPIARVGAPGRWMFARAGERRAGVALPNHSGWAIAPGEFSDCLSALPPLSTMVFGLESVQGYGLLSTRRYRQLVAPGQPRMTRLDYSIPKPLLDLLGASNVVAIHPPAGLDSPAVCSAGRFRLRKNPEAMPHAWLLSHWETMADPQAAVRALRSPTFNPRAVVLLDRPFAPTDAPPSSAMPPALAAHTATDRYAATVAAPQDSVLVTNRSFYPGWRGYVDGRRVKVLRVNHAFQGMPAPSGRHRLAFVFEPVSVKLGAGVSLLAVLLCGWLPLLRCRLAARPSVARTGRLSVGWRATCGACLLLLLAAVLWPQPTVAMRVQRIWDNLRMARDIAERAVERGVACVKANDLAAAEPHYRVAVAAEPDSAWYRYNLSVILARLGKTHEAKEMWTAGLARDPGATLAKRFLRGERRPD